VLVFPEANVVGEQLRAEAGFARLPDSEVAVLTVGDLVQGDGIWSLQATYRFPTALRRFQPLLARSG